MRQIPLWKTVLLVLVLFPSLLYSLPSLMGGIPAWWPKWLPSHVINRGLDLQGGLYLLLNVQTEKAVEHATESLLDEVRTQLRKGEIRHQGVERSGIDTVVVRLAKSEESGRAKELLAKEFPNTQVSEIPATPAAPGELHLVFKPKEQEEMRRNAVEQSIQIIRSRIDQFGVTEPTIQKQGQDRILLEMPGMNDPAHAKALIGRTALLEFKLVDEKGDLSAALAGRVPAGDMLLYGEGRANKGGSSGTRQPYLLKKRTVLTGEKLTDARVSFDSQTGEPHVSITFDRQGASKFAQITGEHVNERMAIVLDNKVYSAPVLREKIEGGRAQISGSFTSEDAHDLAIVLRAGALPAPVVILEERSVGPTMGSDSISQGISSTLIGSGLVIAFMALYYHGFGWLANLAVVFNVLIVIAAMVGIGGTLTMPGIAGLVLLVGMSVDANVLIYERIREELRLGKTPLAAIDQGYNRAFGTILDSHVTALITSLVMFQFGTGPVRGFAVTLSIGLVASVFTAVFVTRVLVDLILKNRRPRTLSI